MERLLDREVPVVEVGRVQRDRPAHRLQVVAAPTGGAAINQHPRVAAAQLVPEAQVALHVLVLGHALAVGGVMPAPVRQRVEVMVLAVQVNALLREHAVHMIGQPLTGRGVAQVQQAVLRLVRRHARLVDEPFGVLRLQPRAIRDALGLEPQERLEAALVGEVADGAQAIGEALRVGLPGAGAGPFPAARIPARVHPPVVQRHARVQVAADEPPLVLFGSLGHLDKLDVAAAEEEGPNGRAVCGHPALGPDTGGMAAGIRPLRHARDVVGQHPAPPEVLGAVEVVPLPEEQGDEWPTDRLPRMEHEVHLLLPGRHAQVATGAAGEGGFPLPRPADRQTQAAAGMDEVEVRKGAVAAAPAVGGDVLVTAGRQVEHIGLVAVGRVAVAGHRVDGEGVGGRGGEEQVAALDVGDGVGVAGVLGRQPDSPLDGREVGIAAGFEPHLQAGALVLPRALGAQAVRRTRLDAGPGE